MVCQTHARVRRKWIFPSSSSSTNQEALNNDSFPPEKGCKNYLRRGPLTPDLHVLCSASHRVKRKATCLPSGNFSPWVRLSQKCHELQFHSKWRRDTKEVFLQASSKYKFTCLYCLKRQLESKPKITSSLRICINLCNMMRKDHTLEPKNTIAKEHKLQNKDTYIWRRCLATLLQGRSLACKDNWIIKGLEQSSIYLSFCWSFLPAQKPFLSSLKTNVTYRHSSPLILLQCCPYSILQQCKLTPYEKHFLMQQIQTEHPTLKISQSPQLH